MVGQSRRRGFTLVEILVVLSIFTVIVTLLLPAVAGVRESSRRSACAANQMRLSNAVMRFHMAKEFLPGAMNNLDRVAPYSPRPSTWFVMLLPYAGRPDVYEGLRQNVGTGGTLQEALCPSGMSSTMDVGTRLLYGINGGTSLTSSYKFDDGAIIDNRGTSRKTLHDIRNGDGLSNTWLTADALGKRLPNGHNDFHNWADTSNGWKGVLGIRNWRVNRPVLNHWKDSSGDYVGVGPLPPRSGHPGGVVVSFCDGRTTFLKDENMAPHIWGHITTSRSIWTGTSYSSGPGAVNSGWANSWLRASGAPPTSQEPLTVTDTDY